VAVRGVEPRGLVAAMVVAAVGCVMRLSKPWGASDSAAPKRSEYMDSLNRPLTCIVFVPVFLSTGKRYTTRLVPWPKIFV
jgi:hypothetical protein